MLRRNNRIFFSYHGNFLITKGGIEGFNSYSISLAYLFGSLFAIFCGLIAILAMSLSYFRVIYSSRYSSDVGFSAAKSASAFVTFLTLGLALIILYLFIFFNEQKNMKPN
jgi:hypothetical protein